MSIIEHLSSVLIIYGNNESCHVQILVQDVELIDLRETINSKSLFETCKRFLLWKIL